MGQPACEGPQAVKLIADVMLGRLARWLRAMGCDTEYFRKIDDAELVARAKAAGRLILTRDALLVKRRWARENHLLIEEDHLRDQVLQVVRTLNVDPFRAFLSRCLQCNTPLHPAEREAVAASVPTGVGEAHRQFRVCPSCGKTYWGGTHAKRMKAMLESILYDQE